MTIYKNISYLRKNAFAPLQIKDKPHPELAMVVVIPCHNEPDLISSLEALRNAEQPECALEVITVINSAASHSTEIKAANLRTLEEGRAWANEKQDDKLKFHFLHFPDLPDKHAGVGLARKIGMDEAVGRLELVENESAPIVCFDADSGCDPDYLLKIEEHFRLNPKTEAASIHFEHPLEGNESPEVYEGILRYELYLRYYVNALKYAGHPHAFHTIGSSMAVRSGAYQKVGGMNRRKAGEDFHFLHKLIPLGRFSNIVTTRVIPSPRRSERVPFGTGRAIGEWLDAPDLDYPVYSFHIFEELKHELRRFNDVVLEEKGIIENVDFWESAAVKEFMINENFDQKLKELEAHTTTPRAYADRFYNWFNGLKVLQFVHFARERHHENVTLTDAVSKLAAAMEVHHPDPETLEDWLMLYRRIDRKAIIA